MAIATIAMSGIGDMNAWQLAAIALVAVGVVALGVTEATEDDELRAARQQASNHKYAKSLLRCFSRLPTASWMRRARLRTALCLKP